MKVSELLNDVEQTLHELGFVPPERLILLKWMSNDLNELTSKIESELFYRHIDPIIQTVEGQRTYDLPTDFPENFARNKADSWVCLIDDGDTEVPLTYESQAEFFSRNLTAESNSKPSTYTILTNAAGRRQIALSPKPDDNSDSNYTIQGLYKANWDLTAETDVPPLPGNCAVLKYAVLMRKLPQVYEPKYVSSVQGLISSGARGKKVVFSPKINGSGGNSYSSMRKL